MDDTAQSSPGSPGAESGTSTKELLSRFIASIVLIAIAVPVARSGGASVAAAIVALAPLVADLLVRLILCVVHRQKRRSWGPLLHGMLWAIAYTAGVGTPALLDLIVKPYVKAVLLKPAQGRPAEVRIEWKGLTKGRSPGVFIRLHNYYYPVCHLPLSSSGEETCELPNSANDISGVQLKSASLDETARQRLDTYWANPTSAGMPSLPPGAEILGGITFP